MCKKDEVRDYILNKFGDINFIEESHQYFIDETEYQSVSSVIHEYEVYVDWDKKAEDYAKKRNLNKYDVQRDWKLNNLKSTISGTKTHEFGESWVNLMLGHPELICEGNRRQYIEEYNTLVPTSPKEEGIVKFYNEVNKGSSITFTPVGAEMKLSTKYIDGARPICGTCDLLLWGEDEIYPEESGFYIGDYKTNKSLYNDYNRRFGVCMLPPFDRFVDESFSHYVLQFNLYQRMLESVGLVIRGRKLIWLKDYDYEVIDVPKIDNKIIDEVIRKKSGI